MPSGIEFSHNVDINKTLVKFDLKFIHNKFYKRWDDTFVFLPVQNIQNKPQACMSDGNDTTISELKLFENSPQYCSRDCRIRLCTRSSTRCSLENYFEKGSGSSPVARNLSPVGSGVAAGQLSLPLWAFRVHLLLRAVVQYMREWTLLQRVAPPLADRSRLGSPSTCSQRKDPACSSLLPF